MNALTQLKQTLAALNEKRADMAVFQKGLSQLEQETTDRHDPAVTSLLKMMQALGKYLDSKKDAAHADSMPVLNSIAACLEKVIVDPDIHQDETRRMAAREIQKFKSLQEKIAGTPVMSANDMDRLKAVILAIDWEISQSTLQNFEMVVSSLMAKVKQSLLHHHYLKIIYSIGQYIGAQKANAHKGSVSFLRSVFENFEKIMDTPGMSIQDKKQLLEDDISRFHEFKTKISLKKDTIPNSTASPGDEKIQPALSHVKKAAISLQDTVVPLTLLPEQKGLDPKGPDPKRSQWTGEDPDPDTDPEAVAPAFANMKNRSADRPRDVMDDLFSTKTSPADELLDEIHLYHVQGSQARKKDQAMDSQSRGIKNFTPQRVDTDPIPEIENRLDEFFNLENPWDKPAGDDDPDFHTIEMTPLDDTEQADGIVPFEYDDHAFEESAQDIPADDLHDMDFDRLIQLKSRMETLDWIRNDAILLSVNQDIASLKQRRQNDPEIICLLEMLANAIEQLKKQSEFRPGLSDNAGDQPMGFWKKLKKIFSA